MNENDAQLENDSDLANSYGAQFEEQANIFDCGNVDGTSNVQALLSELEEGLGFGTGVRDLHFPLPSEAQTGSESMGPTIDLAAKMDAYTRVPSALGIAALQEEVVLNHAFEARLQTRQEVIDLTSEDEIETISRGPNPILDWKKQDPGPRSRTGLLPFSPSLLANVQSSQYEVPSRMVAQSGGLAISSLLPDPTAIPMDALWDFSASQPPAPLYPTSMPDLVAPQPRRHVQDFQLSDDAVARFVGLGITIDATPEHLADPFGPASGDPFAPPVAMRDTPAMVNWFDAVTLAPGEPVLTGLGSVVLPSTTLPSNGVYDPPQTEIRSILDRSLPVMAIPPMLAEVTTSTQDLAVPPKKPAKPSMSSWPDFVMAHYNPRSYTNPTVLHGSPIKVKQSDGPVRGSDLKIVSTRYPFPSRGEGGKPPTTPERRRRPPLPDGPPAKAIPSPARPPNIGQSRKVVQAFAAQKAERNEVRARTGAVGPASLNQERTKRKREKTSAKTDDPLKTTGEVAANRPDLPLEGSAEVDWTIFGTGAAESHVAAFTGGLLSDMSGMAMSQLFEESLLLPAISEPAGIQSAIPLSGATKVSAGEPLLDFSVFNMSLSFMPTTLQPAYIATVDSGVWSSEFMSDNTNQPLLAPLDASRPKRALDTSDDGSGIGRAAKRIRI